MEAKALTPRDLFDGKVCFEIPPFQRPYVWNEEDQWQPLWDDLERVTAALLSPDYDGTQSGRTPGHFLGAVVLKQLPSTAGDPSRLSVIDGQQRLTTLQILLDAAQFVLSEDGDEEDAESLEELVLNASNRFKKTPKRFKLWPSRIDRAAFEHVMDNSLAVNTGLSESRITQAHEFFLGTIRAWANTASDTHDTRSRLSALAQVLQQHLKIVAIDLSDNDDDQLIFETLNDRGTPLLAADLIKNYVFQRGEDLNADVDAWGETYWRDFDDDWWRDQVPQGRLMRSRIDLFLQYWLTMRLQEEISTDEIFSGFRSYADHSLATTHEAEDFLGALRKDADTFREFAQMGPETARGRFYSRVVETLEIGATIPLLLWLISDNHQVPPAQSDRALSAMESWAVRRTLLRMTMKDVNRFVVALLKHLDKQPMESAGDAAVEFLSQQSADARTWPTDDDMRTQLPHVRAYGNIRQQRLRVVLAAIEQRWRTERHENVSLPTGLEIEHVMPQQWQSYWNTPDHHDPQRAAQRDRLISTLGNLTLVTQKLNGTLSHRPWTDPAALEIAATGKYKGMGKRSLLAQYSLLVLNKKIVDHHEAEWTDDDIVARGQELTESIVDIWPHA
ncbi:DUF262 domain-containing protein [Streptosporangium amethystogenes]|uniref:DUF262 domain-containing protein n=1 Tax=Streptosporangium amethystogenes TaxID=2002 RepID=UPI0004C7A64F|nr:DUF262 domain-containing protein [Streptosporangium amethystogenes]